MKNSKSRRANALSGFTLVELIVVIVVLGILAAIGIPRYNNYVNDSRLAHIKADMKTISSLIEVTAMEDDGVFRDSSFDDLSELEKAITEGRAYKEGNLLLQDDIGGGLHTIKDLFIKSNARSKLKGTFLVDNNDEVYYITDKKIKGNTSGESGSTDKEDPEEEIDYGDAHVATDEDFAWIDMTNMINEDGMTNEEALEIGFYTFENENGFGYYEYVGEAKEIVIPHAINGNPITSYFGMFMNTDTEKVISTNPNVTSMSNMFMNNKSLNLDLLSFDTSKVIDMSYMFMNSKSLNLDLSSFDTSKVINMSYMFRGSHSKSLDLSSWNTSSVTNMEGMFPYSSAEELNLSFDTSNVTNMGWMFQGSPAKSLDLSSFNTFKVTDMQYMFSGSSALNLDLSSFDTSNVTDMSWMFESSSAETLDLSAFDTSKVTNMYALFFESSATVGYARTPEDKNNFNDTYGKPTDLTFIIKP